VSAHRLGDASHVGHNGCSFFGREVGKIGRMPATPNGLRVTTLRDSPTKVRIEMGRGKKADAARCSPRRPTLPTHVAPVTILPPDPHVPKVVRDSYAAKFTADNRPSSVPEGVRCLRPLTPPESVRAMHVHIQMPTLQVTDGPTADGDVDHRPIAHSPNALTLDGLDLPLRLEPQIADGTVRETT
jgi:hypothetical protein